MSTPSSSTRVIVGFTACFAILSFFAYSQFNNNKAKSGTEKSEKQTLKARKSSDINEQNPLNDVSELRISCRAMFDHGNIGLVRTIIDMADQRAKTWMSFRISGAQCMVGQVGGKSQSKRPILILDTFVMKPVSPDHRGIREIAFYESIQTASKRSGFKKYCALFGPCEKAEAEIEMKLLHRLEPFTARYFGTIEYDEKQSVEDENAITETKPRPLGIRPNSYILLNNVTKNFSKPCVLDVKLGTKTFEPDASSEKKTYELKKYPLQSDFGFRLTAMRVFDPSNEKAGEYGYVYYPKQFGRSLGTRESLKQALLLFLGGANLPKDIRANRSAAIQRILTRLKLVKGWFRDNKSFAFYGSSILIIYEGDTVQNDVDGIELDMGRAKMIDFGRVRRQPGGDFGFLKGLTTLISLFEEILKESFLGTSKYINASR